MSPSVYATRVDPGSNACVPTTGRIEVRGKVSTLLALGVGSFVVALNRAPGATGLGWTHPVVIAGLLAGGRLGNLTQVRLRWMPAIFLAVFVRYGTEAALSRDLPIAETLRVPLLATAYVILGMVRKEPRSGYEIKALVDNSTRFFWAASYGQIYPELARLEAAGWIAGSDAPRGGRSRRSRRPPRRR